MINRNFDKTRIIALVRKCDLQNMAFSETWAPKCRIKITADVFLKTSLNVFHSDIFFQNVNNCGPSQLPLSCFFKLALALYHHFSPYSVINTHKLVINVGVKFSKLFSLSCDPEVSTDRSIIKSPVLKNKTSKDSVLLVLYLLNEVQSDLKSIPLFLRWQSLENN